MQTPEVTNGHMTTELGLAPTASDGEEANSVII